MGRPKKSEFELNPRSQEIIRSKIQATKLVQRLQDDAFGELVMTEGQRDSAKFLVSKAISAPVPTTDEGKQASGLTVVAWQQ